MGTPDALHKVRTEIIVRYLPDRLPARPNNGDVYVATRSEVVEYTRQDSLLDEFHRLCFLHILLECGLEHLPQSNRTEQKARRCETNMQSKPLEQVTDSLTFSW